jgi:tRNA modification GTPase
VAKSRYQPDTIAAIATGVGGGIGIVRISGPRAEAIVAQLVQPWPKSRPPTHKLLLGKVRDPATGEVIDEVLATVMRAPRSYTGEDVAELQGHGGARVLQRVLDCVIAAGARQAEPGEFTRRAFEAGRIDLTRAEAVAQLIAARSDRALKAAQALAGGALEKEVRALRGEIVHALAELEGALDFPDERLEAPPEAESARGLERLRARFVELASSYRKFVHERAEVVLLGRVNAGKSSLFNALLGEERALVDTGAGTTRDVIEAELDLEGVAVRLVDTAGERLDGGAAERVEQRGLELARKRRGRADATVLVIDGEIGFGEGERQLWTELASQPSLVVWNKRDRAAPSGLPAEAVVVETIASTGEGAAQLKRMLRTVLGIEDEREGVFHVSRRHRDALVAGAESVGKAVAVLQSGEPAEVAAVELRDALHHLGRITGETIDADVLDAIFSRFCIGK